MSLIIGKLENLRDHFASRGVWTNAQVSGGRTSAMIAALTDAVLTFENTGREHPKTYEFLARLEDAIGREIVWLEFRPPVIRGAPPKDFTWARVTYDTADRKGEVFRACLESIAAYRATKNEPPISPWARGRICTVHMKHRVADHWIASQGIDTYDTLIGLRHDEPKRVAGMRKQSTQRHGFRMPLDECKIVKADILAFWDKQPFNLELEEYQGNCTGCFLKDQRDIARAMQERETDPEWWKQIERDFPDFGGADFPGYSVLESEGPVREIIRSSLSSGQEPELDEWDVIDKRRFKLIVRQERRAMEEGRNEFSCACEASYADDD